MVLKQMAYVPFVERIRTRSVEHVASNTIVQWNIKRKTGRATKCLALALKATMPLLKSLPHFLSCLKGITTRPSIGIKFMDSIIPKLKQRLLK